MNLFIFLIYESTETVKFDSAVLMNFVNVCLSYGISNRINETNTCAIKPMIMAP